jgi:glutathione S-transferase
MERLKLFGDSRSGNCYKAALLLKLTKTPFDWIETDIMQGESRSEEFLALNPNGKVPLLVWPDGRCLAESNAMLLHLSRHSPYFPRDNWQQALVWQWLFFEQYSHEPYIAVVRFIVNVAKREADEAERLVMLRQKGYQALQVMEGALQASPFFTGDDLTIADLALYAYTHVAAEGGFKLHGYPAVLSWLERVASQPGHLPMAEACH